MIPHRPSPKEWFNHLLEAARAGCPESMGRLLEEYRGHLLYLANSEVPTDLRPKVAPSDLVQETIVAAYDAFRQFHGESQGEFLVWLRRILARTLLDFLRAWRQRQKRAVHLEVPFDTHLPHAHDPAYVAHDPSPSSECAHREQEAGIRQELGGLPEEYRRVLRMRYYEQATYRQIGQALGVSEEAARKSCDRALAVLGKTLVRGGRRDRPD